MKRTSLRARAGLVAVAIAASVVPLLSASAANAAGVPQAGGASVRTAGGGAALNSGNSDTTFTLRLPSGASCGGDSANDGYRVQTYMVPASVDPSTLTFNAQGPIPIGTGANLRQPLYDTFGSPWVDAQTANAVTPPGPGQIIGIPDFNYGTVFVPGDIPPGAYNLGIACTLGVAGPTQMKEFWNVTKTFTTNAATGGTAEVSWSVGAATPPPVLTSVASGNAQLTATFTHPGSTPASTFTATAAPQAGDVDCTGGPVTSPSQPTTAPILLTGLVNSCTYNVTVTANNGVGSPAVSNSMPGTPLLPVVVPQIIYQELDVSVPPGALVLTQRCGVFGPLPAEVHSTQDSTNLIAVGASGDQIGTAPFTQWDYPTETGTVPVSATEFDQYPTPPAPVTYGTHCRVDMGAAKLITSGAAAGQYYSAHGRLNQVTVADFRDTDVGWTVNGTMGDFTDVATEAVEFSGNHLGWTPVMTDDSEPVDNNSDGTPDYDQDADAGLPVAPLSPGAGGMGFTGTPSGQKLGSAAPGFGIGIAKFDARLKLLIPASARNGSYSGTLTFTFV